MVTDLQDINNNWIYQSNKLIEASYTLTILEQRLIRLLASMIKKDDDDFKEYEFKTKDLIKILNVTDSRFYRDIDKVTDLLMQRIIKIKSFDDKEFEKYHWVEVAKYKNGVLKLKINKDLKPFYLSLDWYTKYQLKNIMQFKSTYSFRLYELLKQYENIGNRMITIDNLRIVLDISKDQYSKYGSLKQKVINVAVNEINTNTDLYINYEEFKEVRKVISIKFYIRKNNKVINEVAAGLGNLEEVQPLTSIDTNIKTVQAIFEEEITIKEAETILNVANKDIGKIREKYKIISNLNQVNNVVGAMIKALRENWTTINKSKTDSFNDYDQRSYDFKDLEGKLTAWEDNF